MRIGQVTRYDAPRRIHLLPKLGATGGPIVLLHEGAVREMMNHARRGEPLEVIGALLGFPVVDASSDQPATYVELAVPYRADATRAHVSMHLSSYADLDDACRQTETLQVGYYHSHPGLGIFQSGIDVANFTAYHPEPYQLAVVVDSTRQVGDAHEIDATWIGIFVWDGQKRPMLLPEQGIQVVQARPEVIQQEVRPADDALGAGAPETDAADHGGGTGVLARIRDVISRFGSSAGRR